MNSNFEKRIIKDGNFAIYRLSDPVFGGRYAVVNIKERKAKTGLCLDAAYEIFRQLTTEQALRKANMLD